MPDPDKQHLRGIAKKTRGGSARRQLPSADIQYSMPPADRLLSEGFVVVPFADATHLAALRAGFDRVLTQAPEFRDADVHDATCKFVQGGFGALGTPTSFHHPIVRRAREEMMAAVVESHVLPLGGRKLEMTFDRIVFRRAGQAPTKESLHRDEAPTASDGDDVFGGWLNLDLAAQWFHCCPRTHVEVGTQNKGFAKIRDPALVQRHKAGLRRVAVAPGHILIFYERIVHEVAPVKATCDMRRIHAGWRLTHSDEPLFGRDATDAWIGDQAVPRLKSGQEPTVFPAAHANFSRHWDGLQRWSLRHFGHLPESAVYRHRVKSTDDEMDGAVYWRVRAKFPSLRRLSDDTGGSVRMHAPYDDDERALFAPRRTWWLYRAGAAVRTLCAV